MWQFAESVRKKINKCGRWAWQWATPLHPSVNK